MRMKISKKYRIRKEYSWIKIIIKLWITIIKFRVNKNLSRNLQPKMILILRIYKR
jgi:hypothetical protein